MSTALVFTSIILAFMLGGTMGALAMSLMKAASNADRQSEQLQLLDDRDELGRMFDEKA